jgi:hypothetical protein
MKEGPPSVYLFCKEMLRILIARREGGEVIQNAPKYFTPLAAAAFNPYGPYAAWNPSPAYTRGAENSPPARVSAAHPPALDQANLEVVFVLRRRQ